nr:hypothetical protein CFP56_68648 [Quercus suber]
MLLQHAHRETDKDFLHSPPEVNCQGITGSSLECFVHAWTGRTGVWRAKSSNTTRSDLSRTARPDVGDEDGDDQSEDSLTQEQIEFPNVWRWRSDDKMIADQLVDAVIMYPIPSLQSRSKKATRVESKDEREDGPEDDGKGDRSREEFDRVRTTDDIKKMMADFREKDVGGRSTPALLCTYSAELTASHRPGSSREHCTVSLRLPRAPAARIMMVMIACANSPTITFSTVSASDLIMTPAERFRRVPGADCHRGCCAGVGGDLDE